MQKVLDFIKNEIAEVAVEKCKIESEVHRMKINLEMTQKIIKRIIGLSDKTGDIFSVSESINYNNKEVDTLQSQKENIQNTIDEYIDRGLVLEKRLQELNLVLAQIEEENLKKRCENMQLGSMNPLMILEIQEKERQRIARDIHDSVVQNMTALIHKTEFVMKVVDTDSSRAKLELEVVNKLVRECIDELRGIIFDLRPMSIDDLGLEITIKRCIQQFNNSTDMNINLDFVDSGVEVNFIVTITILRIIQELCNNSIKYSKGTTIDISIILDNHYISIIHEDDGIGFDEGDMQKESCRENTGFGLSMLKERVSLLGGSIEIERGTQNRGMKYFIDIPCISKEKI